MMQIEFKNNPNYRAVITTASGITFYEPAGDTAYHQSRYVAASAINVYCNAGITPELLVKILDEMEKSVNSNKLSDVAVWINNLRYRTRYPVDDDAAIRLAIVFFFVEGENPNKVESHWTEHKLKLVKEDPAASTFFMEYGMQSSSTYSASVEGTSPLNSIQRKEDLQALTPHR